MYKVMTIAGSDSGGGAGIQADLKTFAALQVYGTSAITALTAQNTRGVQAVLDIPPEFVGQQIDSIMADIGTDAAKIGMLSNEAVIAQVAAKIRQHRLSHVVLDPVMVAKGGDPLLQPSAVEALKTELLPLAEVLTPNLPEAAALAGFPVDSVADMARAAERLLSYGAKWVVIKGGHLEGSSESVDWLSNGSETHRFAVARIETQNSHGTGCTFSSAIAAGLAKGLDVVSAVAEAKTYLTRALSAADTLRVGHGHGPVHHFAAFYTG